jgi:hypothetical protein
MCRAAVCAHCARAYLQPIAAQNDKHMMGTGLQDQEDSLGCVSAHHLQLATSARSCLHAPASPQCRRSQHALQRSIGSAHGICCKRVYPSSTCSTGCQTLANVVQCQAMHAPYACNLVKSSCLRMNIAHGQYKCSPVDAHLPRCCRQVADTLPSFATMRAVVCHLAPSQC